MLERHWWIFLTVLVAPAAAFAVVARLWSWGPSPSGFQHGFGWGLVIGLSIGGVLLLFASLNFDRRLTGAQAERWSTSELLELDRHGWHLINDVPTDRGNIDHVLIGQRWALVVETKFFDVSPWEDQILRRACKQARRGARRVELLVHQAGLDDFTVIPAVLRWGSGTSAKPAREQRGNVRVLAGFHADQWRTTLLEALPSSRPSETAVNAIESYAGPRREGEQADTNTHLATATTPSD